MGITETIYFIFYEWSKTLFSQIFTINPFSNTFQVNIKFDCGSVITF